MVDMSTDRSSSAIQITNGRIALVIAFALLVWELSHVLLIIFFTILLALIVRGSADWLAKQVHAPPRLMLAVVSIVIVAACAGLVYWLGPRLIVQSQDLINRLTGQFETLRQHFSHSPMGQRVTSDLSSIGSFMFGTAETAVGIGFTMAVDLVVMAVTTLYLSVHPRLYIRGILYLIPPPRRDRALDVMYEIAHVLRLWVLGQMIDMITVGAMAAIGLMLLGVPAPYALAVLAGLLTFIPYVGAIAAGVPAVLMALTTGWTTALWTVLLYAACHLVEGYIVAPLVQRRLIDLPPALSILSMTIMGALFGLLGVILGTPLAVAALVIVRELYVKDTLGDHVEPAADAPRLWKRRIMAPETIGSIRN
jgi:predicted PurR-regulated permease PerM